MKEMGVLLWALPAIGAGVCVAIQTGVNSQLRLDLQSPLLAAFVSFFVGTLALGLLLALRGQLGINWQLATAAPWWVWTGGLLGAIYVSSIVWVAPKIGAVAATIYVLFGQLIMSIILDHHGWLGLPKISLSLERIVGLIFMLVGVILVLKSPFQFDRLR